MADRRAPDGGYDFGNKRNYRRKVWGLLRDTSGDVMIMPSAEGDEIDVALARGVQESKIHIVDMNPAIVASLKRRYPLVHTYGVDVVRAAQRMSKRGVKLSAANLDLTGCISSKTLRTLQGFFSAEVLAEDALVAVTVLRGRESGMLRECIVDWAKLDDKLYELCDELGATDRNDEMFQKRTELRDTVNMAWSGTRRPTSTDYQRLYLIGSVAIPKSIGMPLLCRAASYKSGSQTMLFSVWRILDWYAYMRPGWKAYVDLEAAYCRAGRRESKQHLHVLIENIDVGDWPSLGIDLDAVRGAIRAFDTARHGPQLQRKLLAVTLKYDEERKRADNMKRRTRPWSMGCSMPDEFFTPMSGHLPGNTVIRLRAGMARSARA